MEYDFRGARILPLPALWLGIGLRACQISLELG